MDEDLQPGATWTDPNTNSQYIYTGSEWQQYDSGGMDSGGGSTTTSTSTSTPTAIPDGGVDASGNPTYVDSSGNPVTADGTPIASANDAGVKTQRFDDGSMLFTDKDGNVIGSRPATDAAGNLKADGSSVADTLKNLGTKAVDSIKGFFQKKDAKGNPIPGQYDWAKVAGAGVAMYGALGGNKPETGGYQGKIPSYTATREQINYNDPNRRPGAQGRQYFTNTQYGAEGAAPAAKAAAQAQGTGILANYTPAAAPVNKWNATNAVATPWNKPAVAAPAANPINSGIGFMTPEQKLASLQPKEESAPVAGDVPMQQGIAPMQQETIQAAMGGIMPLAKGRYLQGATDGMADQINTSIDGQQPAKLSHGEFVVPADVVSHLGNGNSDAGAKKLYSMMDKIRMARTGTKKQGKQINPDKYMPGGTVNKYAAGGIAQLPTKKFVAGGSTYGPATDTTTSSTLSPWAGDYVTNMLGKGQALANAPFQTYQGPLTAGPSDLQQQQFAGISSLAQTGLTPTQYNTGTFGTDQAQQYMNPYLMTALNPQLDEMKRRSQINLQPDLAKLTQAGGYGGGRQAIMQSEANRNLLSEQDKAIGQGYFNAYDKAATQFNADQQRALQAQQFQQAANEASANYGLKSLESLGQAGATQRGIESEGLAADKAQFEEQRDYPYKMVQYQQGLLQGLPISTQSNTQNMSAITNLLASLGYGGNLYNAIDKFGTTPAATPPATAPAATPPASSGVTGGGSSGVTP
jgi:hypothetical protein